MPRDNEGRNGWFGPCATYYVLHFIKVGLIFVIADAYRLANLRQRGSFANLSKIMTKSGIATPQLATQSSCNIPRWTNMCPNIHLKVAKREDSMPRYVICSRRLLRPDLLFSHAVASRTTEPECTRSKPGSIVLPTRYMTYRITASLNLILQLSLIYSKPHV